MSTEYGRRARVTAGDLKQIMQAQADAFFGMSSQIAALHEHVEMLKERYLREVRREFRNTNNQRELTENGRRNMSRWERGGDLGDRDPYVFQSTHFFMFPLRQSNYKNITHLYRKKIKFRRQNRS